MPSKNNMAFYNQDQTPSSWAPRRPFTIPGILDGAQQLWTLNSISVANIVKKHMKATGIDTKIYGPDSRRSANSMKAAELGNKIDTIKKYANWNLSAHTFERFYYKLPHQHAEV